MSTTPPKAGTSDEPKFTPRQRLKANYSEDDDVSIEELFGFGACLLAEKIYHKDKTSDPKPMKMDPKKGREEYLENFQGALTAAIQVIQTKGKPTNAKGEKIKITTNYVGKGIDPISEELDDGWYDIWKSICADLGINLTEQASKNALNNMLSGESVYRDLEQITQSQQGGLAKTQLGNEQFYPYYLGSGKKGATMAACAPYVGIMALFNEAIRIAKVLAKMGNEKKGPKGETEALLGYMTSILRQRIGQGNGWIIDTIISLAGDPKQVSVLESLKSMLGRYFGLVTPSRKLPTLPPLVVMMTSVLLSNRNAADKTKKLSRFIRMFNHCYANCVNETILFASYKLVGQPNGVACRKLEVLFVHFSGMTFGNLEVLNEYCKEEGKRGNLTVLEIFTNGMLTFENITGGLGKMGKFAFFKKHAKLERCDVHAVDKTNDIYVDFKRDIVAGGQNRNAVPSMPVEVAGDATQGLMFVQPTSAASQQKSPTEFIDAMNKIFETNVGYKALKGKVGPQKFIHGIVLNLSARKDGVLDRKEIYTKGVLDLIKVNMDVVSGAERELQQRLCVATAIALQEIMDEGYLEVKEAKDIKTIVLVKDDKNVEIPAGIKRKMADLTKAFETQSKKAKKNTGWSQEPDFDMS